MKAAPTSVAPEPLLVLVDEPGPYLTVKVLCQMCRAEISCRRFDVRDGISDAEVESTIAGDVWRAHARACPIGALGN